MNNTPLINFGEIIKNYNNGEYLKMVLGGVKDVWNIYNRILSIDQEDTYLITLFLILKLIDKYNFQPRPIPVIKSIIISDTCSICMEQYEINQKIYRTNCHHHFCIDCLQKWFSVKNSCPMCRTEITQLKEVLYVYKNGFP